MRALVLPLILLAPGLSAEAQDLTLQSKHYDLRTNGTKEEGQELLDFMELVFNTYMALLKPVDPREAESRRSTIVLYKDNQSYLASGAPSGSGAYYSLDGKELVGYYDPILTKPFFAHEGMHQFTDLTSKNFRDFPMWFSEGIADCIGNSEVREKKLYMCVKSGAIARGRLPLVQEAIQEGRHFPLARLMRMSRQEFMDPQNVSLAYAQSWSFCHFLITSPAQEDRANQVPNGRYRRNLAIYYENIRAGDSSHDQAWAKAFKDLPLETLEEQWKKYVTAMDRGRILGFAGRELTDEEAKELNLPEDRTGIRIDRLAEDGAAKKAGLREGDIMISYDGHLFPRRDAMNRLRVWMQAPLATSGKIKALRNGKEIEVVVRWPSKK